MIYWNTPNLIIRWFKNLIWHYSRLEKVIYLTFDDGPTPVVTEMVLEILKRYNAKATFFCLGRNVDRHPEVYSKVLNEGHSVGNHTYSHLKGWSTPLKSYFYDIQLAQKYVQSDLFRPPYGRIRKLQIRYLSRKFKIVMWDVLTHDYDTRIPAKMCLKFAVKSTKPGSIVVFHDSEKASKNLLYVLPHYLEYFSSLGYKFCSIS